MLIPAWDTHADQRILRVLSILYNASEPQLELNIHFPVALSCVCSWPELSLLCLLFIVFNICSSDDVSSNRPDSSYVYSSHVEERPPPPYPSSSSHPGPHHFYPKPPPCARPVAPGPESQPPSSPPPPLRWTGFGPLLLQPQPPPSSSSSSSSSSLDINSNPKPSCLHFPKHGPMCDAPHAAPPDANASPLYIKTPLVLTRHDVSLGNPPSLPSSAPPPWAACPCARERGPPRLTR